MKPTTHNPLRRISQTDLNTPYVVPCTGRCTSPICPIPYPHTAGRYRHLGLDPRSNVHSYPFGTSNPPPEIEEAWQRVLIARSHRHPCATSQAQWLTAEELGEDQKAVEGYVRLHADARDYQAPEDLKVDKGILRPTVPARKGPEVPKIRSVPNSSKRPSKIFVAEDNVSDDADSTLPTSASIRRGMEIDCSEEDETEIPNFLKRKWALARGRFQKPKPKRTGKGIGGKNWKLLEESGKVAITEEKRLFYPPSNIAEDDADSRASESDSCEEKEDEKEIQSEVKLINDIFGQGCRYFPCTCGEFPLYCERFLADKGLTIDGGLPDIEDLTNDDVNAKGEVTMPTTTRGSKGKKPDTGPRRKDIISDIIPTRREMICESSSESELKSSTSSSEMVPELPASRVKAHYDVFYEEPYFCSVFE